jgi:hypothetical protein
MKVPFYDFTGVLEQLTNSKRLFSMSPKQAEINVRKVESIQRRLERLRKELEALRKEA